LDFSRRLNKLSSTLSSFGFSKEAFIVLSMPMQLSIPIDVEVFLAPSLMKIYRGAPYRLEVISRAHGLWAAILDEEKEYFSKMFRIPIVISLKKEDGLGDYFDKFEPIGILNLTRGFGERDWRITSVGLVENYKSKGFGTASYDWVINNFIPKLISKSGEDGGVISDSVQTADSKRMWIKLLEKNMLDLEKVDSSKIVVLNEKTKQEHPIVKKEDEWFYNDGQSLKPIWSGDSSSENIVLKLLNNSNLKA